MNMKKKMKAFFTFERHANDGFTLVELIVVIAILAILGGVAVPAYSGYVKKAERAGDEQLLAAINKAYASACLENGTDMALLRDTGASMPLETNKTVKLDGVAPYGEAFKRYYAGNEASAFKVFKSIVYDGDVGMFVNIDDAGRIVVNVNGKVYVASGADIQSWKNGALGDMPADVLAALVGDASDMIASDEWALYRENVISSGAFLTAAKELLGGVEYADYIKAQIEEKAKAEYGNGWDKLHPMDQKDLIDEAEAKYKAQIESNMMALVTTKTAESASVGIIDLLKTNGNADYNPKDAIKANVMDKNNATLGVTQSALAYGLYLSYAEREGLDTTGLTAQGALNKLREDDFQKYLTTDEAKTDLESFKAALNVVGEQNKDTISDVATGGFGNQDLVNALEQLLGGK